ncbi:eCIS core domain-containing protein [Hymenobacter antarcticus]|uniref:eCIS core domain-containing protein n=1 Tax=Hymenobacter antarcticus TaxID=486270 RepID=A0ABP7QT26_9BACT
MKKPRQLVVIRPPSQRPKRIAPSLPDRLRTGVESLSGHSLDDVQVHYNSAKPAQLEALAYAQGANIRVAPGQARHLPHAAWHVVQQLGRVRPTVHLDGLRVTDDVELEREADIMGSKAAQVAAGAGSASDALQQSEA